MPTKPTPEQPEPENTDTLSGRLPDLAKAAQSVTASVEPASADPASPEPAAAACDEYGRVRVLDQDTGHQLTISTAALLHGNYSVLDEPASTLGGDPLPPAHHESPVETTTSGQQAESKE